jgi:hypothetical protein
VLHPLLLPLLMLLLLLPPLLLHLIKIEDVRGIGAFRKIIVPVTRMPLARRSRR